MRDAGDVELVGLIQEQHPDRCSLFMQWKDMDFPILVDSLNRIGVSAVPLLWAIDEHGVVRKVRPDFAWFEETFLATEYSPVAGNDDIAQAESAEGTAVRAYLEGDFSTCIQMWEQEVQDQPGQGSSWFRLGCAYRARYDSEDREGGDFQNAVRAWSQAVELEPRNYIYHRRLQQYGPRMMKPYPFYDWVPTARKELTAKGHDPHPLIAEPEGAELAQRARKLETSGSSPEEPDAQNRLEPDEGLIQIEGVVVPFPVTPGKSARISLSFAPSRDDEVHWTNDAGPLTAVLNLPQGWKIDARVKASDVPVHAAATDEIRRIDFEILVPEGAESKTFDLSGYAVYYICEGEEGECLYLRQDFSVEIPIQD